MPKVTLFTHNECKQCIAVRRFLTENNIAFDELDVELDSSALQQVVELTGSATHVPVLRVEDEVFIDFDDEIAKRILELCILNVSHLSLEDANTS